MRFNFRLQGVSTVTMSNVVVFSYLDPIQYPSVFSNLESPPILYPVWVSEIGNPNLFTPPNATIFCPVGWYCCSRVCMKFAMCVADLTKTCLTLQPQVRGAEVSV